MPRKTWTVEDDENQKSKLESILSVVMKNPPCKHSFTFFDILFIEPMWIHDRTYLELLYYRIIFKCRNLIIFRMIKQLKHVLWIFFSFRARNRTKLCDGGLHLYQACTTYGPRAKCGPWELLIWPAKPKILLIYLTFSLKHPLYL